MDYVPLISIPFIYILVALIKPYLQPKLPFKLCAICIAVSLTWLMLIGLALLHFSVSLLEVGILMGMSVTGIMYESEAYFERQKLQHFWFVRLVIIIGGLYSVYLFLEESWSILTLIAIASILSIVITTFLLQGTSHVDVLKEQSQKGMKQSLIKKLDDCC